MGKKREKMVCGEDVFHAIRNAYPENMVSEDVLYDEDSYYDAIREDVQAALIGIKGTMLKYERPPEGGPRWNEGSDPDEDPPDWAEAVSSYDLVFLGLEGSQFEFTGELPEDDDPEGAIMVPTTGRIGCAVGISTIAPFAVVRFTETEWSDTGSRSDPDIFPSLFELDWTEVDMKAHYEELYLEEGIHALRELRKEIGKVLRRFGIRVLADPDLKQGIPGLMPDEERYLLGAGDPVTVESALFFRGL